ncbi:DUF6049 family protein [uncultured Pseudokineococcus sp.]|uniref:DUF6049 family protein n=1 Tax=uncultured Pseudokineococcus sp. TaxID=1642928 RepID=UPI00262B803D|nr:DUF6049 family protein [uncultured Pseudokineococcus sp.]
MAEARRGRAAVALVALAAGAAGALGWAPAARAGAVPTPPPTQQPGPSGTQDPGAQDIEAQDLEEQAPAPQRPADAPAAADAPDAVDVDITALTSAPLRPDDVLAVGVRVTNGTDEPVEGLTAELRLQPDLLRTRDALGAWSGAPDDAAAGEVLLGEPLLQPLPPGRARDLVLRLPADELGLPGDDASWGPRGVAVDVVDARGSRLSADRGLVVWYLVADGAAVPDVDDPARVGVVVPLTGAAPDVGTALVPDAEMADLVDGGSEGSRGGVLGRLLEVAAVPGTTWALDPLLLDSSDPGTADPSADEASDGADDGAVPGQPGADGDAADDAADDAAGGAAATAPPDGATAPPAGAPRADTAADPTAGVAAWRADLLAAAPDHEVLALPRGDVDLLSVAAAEQPSLWAAGLRQGRASLARAGLVGSLQQTDPQQEDPPAGGEAGAGVRTDVVWPARGELGERGAALAAGRGAVAALLAPPGGGTSDGAAAVHLDAGATADGGEQGALTGLVEDADLTTLLERAATRGEDDPRAAARLLAETAVLARGGARDRSGGPAGALVVAPRGWDVDPGAATRALGALLDAPWTRAAPATGLPGGPGDADAGAGSGREGALPDRADGAPPPPLDPGVLTAVAGALATTDALDGTLTDGAPLTAARRSLVAAAALAHRGDDGWAAAAGAAADEVATLSGGVQLLQGGTVTVVGSQASVPVTVANDLGQDVRVVVAAASSSPRVRVRQDVATTVAAASRTQVLVPVEAVGGGDARLLLQLRSPDGGVLGPQVAVPVRVRLEWAEWGTAGVAALGGLVLLAGLVRSVRRVRRRPPGEGPRSSEPVVAAGAGPPPGATAEPRAAAGPPAGPGAGTPPSRTSPPGRPPPGSDTPEPHPHDDPQTRPRRPGAPPARRAGGAARTGAPVEESP